MVSFLTLRASSLVLLGGMLLQAFLPFLMVSFKRHGFSNPQLFPKGNCSNTDTGLSCLWGGNDFSILQVHCLVFSPNLDS